MHSACHASDMTFPFNVVEGNGWGEFVADPADAHALTHAVQALLARR